MKMKLCTSVAFAALLIPGVAFAQSTGSVDFEKGEDIVVTARTAKGVAGVQVPDTAKAKLVLNQAFISRQTPGNTILDTINQLPGVSFTNNDPFGSAGGTLTIRGFSSDRISLTFDGIPLNDSGNYAIFSNQQIDPELIDNVNVNLGTTDVDSPTAAASGSTVNYRTSNPTDEFGARLVGSVGDFKFFRVFGQINTGEFGPFGTKAWFSASHAENNNVYGNFGVIDKQQYNGKIYQRIGNSGDFISIRGHYNQNRNNFFGSVPLRTDLVQSPINAAVRVVGGASANRFPLTGDERFYSIGRCTTDNVTVRTGLADPASSCGTQFEERFNPSNTGNIQINSRFTLAPGLVLTVDPSFQYVKANGGGTATAREAARDIDPTGGTANCTTVTTGAGVNCTPGYFGGNPFVGRDLNGDGDILDQVNLLAPSQTQTRRYGVLASLRYEFAQGQSVRLTYSFDRARHRQTGEVGFLKLNGAPFDVFPVNNPIAGSNSVILQKRDRLSYATLNQVAAEYRGEFGGATVTLGLRAPFFQRDLTNNCFTSSAGGFVECYGSNTTLAGQIATANPTWAAPQSRTLKYNRVLPSIGATYKFGGGASVYASYTKGLQVPSTDNLYNAFFFPVNTAQARPAPETTDNFDAGFRYTTSKLQVQVGPWFTRYSNRLASAYDPTLDVTVFRNLGTVDKYGFDGNIDYRPIPQISIHAFASYLKSEIKDNVLIGECPATLSTVVPTPNCTVAGAQFFAATAGKRESGFPDWTFGGRVAGQLGPLQLGVQVKRTGRRFVNDQNLPVIQCTVAVVNNTCRTAGATGTGATGIQYQVFGATAPAFTLVDLDARLSLEWAGLNDKTYLQFNLQNAFDELYVNNIGGNVSNFSIPNANIGSPRAFSVSLNAQF